MVVLFRWLSHWPLGCLHALGSVGGWLAYATSGRYRKRWNDNRAQAGLTPAQVRGAIAHNGRMMLELPRLWLGKPVPYQWQGVELLEAAYAQRRGIVFLTPHIGCFEITAQAVAERFSPRYGDLTVMYKPERQRWMADMLAYVRNRPGLQTVTTSVSGVRQMMRELRAGRAIGLLPDHVPPEGQGVWAPLFGKPAYTMTLAAKLAHQSGAALIVVWGERLPSARGFLIHCLPLHTPLPKDLTEAVTHINQAMEQVILANPNQYMWSYARYRAPRPQEVQAAPDATDAGTPPAP